MSTYIRLFYAALETAKATQVRGLSWSVPTQRFPELNEKLSAATMKAIGVITAVEEWGIVDPRMKVFQVAMNAAIFDVRTAGSNYINTSMFVFPILLPDGSGRTIPWSPPNDETFARVRHCGDAVMDALSDLSSYAEDFRMQMQQALIGPLFPKNKVKMRVPLNPALRVIELDRGAELIRYFETETTWGEHKRGVEEAVRQEFAPPPVRN